jgi:spore coat protein CotH
VDLWINDEHLGLYIMIEEVDGDFVDERFDDDSGDLYKAEPPGGTLLYRGEDRISDYTGMEIETNERSTDHSAFFALVRTLDRGTNEALSRVLDIDNALRYIAFATALTNLDSYLGMGHNFYLYEERGLFHVIPWDLNEAFGTFTCQCSPEQLIDFLIDEPTCGPLAERPLVARLLAIDEHRNRYHELLREFLDGIFDEAEMNARIDAIAAMIRPYLAGDAPSFYTLDIFERSLEEDVVAGEMGSGIRMAIGLRRFLRDRRAAIQAQLAGEAPSAREGEGACTGGAPPDGRCGDGTCDDFERSHPGVCPADCG